MNSSAKLLTSSPFRITGLKGAGTLLAARSSQLIFYRGFGPKEIARKSNSPFHLSRKRSFGMDERGLHRERLTRGEREGGHLVKGVFLHVLRSTGARAEPVLRVLDEEALDEVFGQRAHVFGERRVLLGDSPESGGEGEMGKSRLHGGRLWVAQRVDRVVRSPQAWWFDPWLFLSKC